MTVDTQTLFAFLRIQKGIKNLDYNSDFAEAVFTQRVIACSLDRISNDLSISVPLPDRQTVRQAALQLVVVVSEGVGPVFVS